MHLLKTYYSLHRNKDESTFCVFCSEWNGRLLVNAARLVWPSHFWCWSAVIVWLELVSASFRIREKPEREHWHQHKQLEEMYTSQVTVTSDLNQIKKNPQSISHSVCSVLKEKKEAVMRRLVCPFLDKHLRIAINTQVKALFIQIYARDVFRYFPPGLLLCHFNPHSTILNALSETEECISSCTITADFTASSLACVPSNAAVDIHYYLCYKARTQHDDQRVLRALCSRHEEEAGHPLPAHVHTLRTRLIWELGVSSMKL